MIFDLAKIKIFFQYTNSQCIKNQKDLKKLSFERIEADAKTLYLW